MVFIYVSSKVVPALRGLKNPSRSFWPSTMRPGHRDAIVVGGLRVVVVLVRASLAAAAAAAAAAVEAVAVGPITAGIMPSNTSNRSKIKDILTSDGRNRMEEGKKRQLSLSLERFFILLLLLHMRH